MKETESVEKYFNTENEHFNNNAYAWYSSLKRNELFSNIELLFQILLEYLYFLENYKTPISCVKRLNQKMTENNLTKKQKIFIYDKLLGLIVNDYDNRDNLSSIYIEILEFRLELEPYENLDIENYSIDGIKKKASMINDLYERLKFLKHKKLEYEREADEIGWDIGLGEEIEIEIQILEKQIKEYERMKIMQNHSGKGDNIGGNKIENHYYYEKVGQTATPLPLFDHNPKRQPIDKAELKDLIVDGETDEVFETLLEKSQDAILSREIELLKTKWRGIKREHRKSTISDNDFEVKNTKITETLLEWIGEW